MAVQPIETTWMEQVLEISAQSPGNDLTVLMFTLANGHRYAIPLDAQKREAIKKLLNPVPVFGPGDIPTNGHGA